MKKIIVYLKNYRKEAILGPLFKLFEAILELLIPLVVSNIINEGIKNDRGTGYIFKMVAIMIVLGLIGLLCSITAQYFSAKAATGVSKELREKLFSKIQSFSYTEIDTIGASRMINEITADVNQVQNGVNLFLRLFLRSPFVVIGALIMAFIVSPSGGLIFMLIIPILLAIIFVILYFTRKKYQDVQSDLDVVVRRTRENLQGVRVIRAFVKEDNESKDFNNSLNKLASSQKKVNLVSTILNPITYVIINIGIILVVYVGAKQVESQKLLQGDVIALYNYMGQILVELIKFANLVITISKSLASFTRISKTLDVESSLKFTVDNEIHSTNFLEFNDVSFMYQNGGAYANINFSCEKGETIGIIGGTGSGKTTLINLIPHFYDCQKGNIYLEGKNINSYDLVSLRKRIGLVPQKAVLFKGTIRSNLEWKDKNALDGDMLDALEIAQGLDIIRKKQAGLDAVVEENGQNFSGGQKQRLAIARALIGSPDILIFDDSASALDYLTDSKLRKALKMLPNKPLVFIISQRTSSIMHADKIIVLDNGKIVGIGKHEELLRTSVVYKEIYDSQFKKGGK
ncbi:MAG: ATP-binding protein [Coprobacillus sp. 28_7]|nr:MAG: ATP-binding protein [Coprobacillus sp. 28_7]